MMDRRVIYDGYANTYLFNKDEHKITPIPNPKPNPKKPHSSLTIIHANMQCVLKKSIEGRATIPREARPNFALIESSLRTNSAETGENVGTTPSCNNHSFNPPFKDYP